MLLFCVLVSMPFGARADIVSSGLIQDLDADVGVTANGANVTVWANQAPSGGDDMTTNGGNPQLVTGPNGHSAISLSGGARMSGSDNAAFDAILQGSGHTWFAVIRPANQGGGGSPAKNAIFGTLLNGNPWSGIVAHVNGTTGSQRASYMLRPTPSDFFITGTTDIHDNEWHIVAGRLAAGTGNVLGEVFTDGPSPESTSSAAPIGAASNSDALTIGAERTGGGEQYDGEIARILIYNRPLTDQEFNQTGGALAQAYAINDHGFITGPLPEINLFTASAFGVSAGTPVDLTWDVVDPEGGTPTITITPGVGDVTGTNTTQVTPATTTTYTLLAENINGSSSAQITVAVDEPPVIDFLTAADPVIRLGESTTLQWSVAAADGLSLDQGVGDVIGMTSVTVSPATTTTYTLTASNEVASVTAQVTVTVDLSPVILSFAVDRNGVDPGEMITLSWEVTGADTLSIDQNVGDVTGQTSVQDFPQSTRTYQLTAVNVHGTSTATLTVIVGETVTLSEFLARNGGGLLDEDGDSSDWIELRNTTATPIDITGWYLTDDPLNLTLWQIPSVVIPAGEFLVLFASGKDRRDPGSELHTNFELNGSGDYLALVKSDGQTIVRQFAPAYPDQEEDISYGVFGAGLQEGYFDPPTPGAPNGIGFDGFVDDTEFSHRRGFYDAPFDVTITTDTVDAEIRYTLDGSEPTATTGQVYNGPITISGTTVLRAAAFKAGLKETNVDTQTYLFTSDIRTQSDMDGDVLNVPPYSGSIEDDLKSLPTLSLVLPDSSLFGGSGIYSNPGGRGPTWERAVSVEFFSADGLEEFQENAGIRIHGADARNHQKKPFKLYFRSEYGAGRLRYPLFPGSVREFDKLVLRGAGHEAWTSPYGSGSGAQAWSASYIRDEFLRSTHGEMGHLSPRGRFVHLYLNGDYWGLYNVHERADEEFSASHLGGPEEDYDVIKTGGAVVDGTKSTWNTMMNLANAGLSSSVAYNQMLTHLDVDNLIDNMIVRIWSADIDWLRSANTLGETGNRNKNWYAARRSRGEAGLWNFFVWDGELSMGKGHRSNRNLGFDLTDVDINDSPGRLYTRLRDNADFRLRFADRLQKHFFNDGAMTVANNQARWNALADQVRHAVVAESARWGDAVRNPPFTRDGEWQNEVTWMSDVFIAQRHGIVLDQFRAIGLFPDVAAPVFNQFGGNVPAGFQVSMANPNGSGVIFFTTDRSDPRMPGGAVSPSAQAYSVPLDLVDQTRVRARVKMGDDWSPEISVEFFTPQDFTRLQVTEIMYNPPAFGLFEGNDVEFLELKNTGSVPLALGGLTFTAGLTYTFPIDAVLAPGSFYVLVRDPVAFAAKYPGVSMDGVYTGRLDNGGEKLRISHILGGTVVSVDYDDVAPWPVVPDNFGYSLVPMDPNNNPAPNQPENWRVSSQQGGSPGADDPAAGIPLIVINEVQTHTDLPAVDAIEIYNPTGSDQDIGGWFLTDDKDAPRKYRIPDGTMIGASAYMVFDENDFNPTPGLGTSFSLSSHGESVYLMSGDAQTNLTGYSHGFRFGGAENGVTFGRLIISTGQERFPAQLSNSLGGANAGPRIGPVVISEIMYHPALGEDEFIELRNVTGAAVPLYDPANPTNTWRLNGLGYALPENVVLGPNERLLLVPVAPETFRARYGLSPAIPIFGPYEGVLQDSGENLELIRPDQPDTNGLPWIVVDAVRYNDKAPWPPAADGSGPSLQRPLEMTYGNEPANWVAAVATPGAPLVLGQPPVITDQPDALTVVAFQPAAFQVTAVGTAPLRYQWLFDGDPIPAATNANLTLPAVDPVQAGAYSVVVFNAEGSVTSSDAILSILIPATITLQPRPQTVDPGANVTFQVQALSSTPLTYQWRKNGIPIPGATDDSLQLTNVQGEDDALYDVVVTDGVGPITSDSVRLTVLIRPSFVISPLSQSVVEGGCVTFSVRTEGTLPMGFRWRSGSSTVKHEVLNSHVSFFTIDNVQVSDGGSARRYSVVATNEAFFQPGRLSGVAILTVLADSDGDGMSDDFENTHGLNAADPADAAGDLDLDGVSNLDESISGTDPTDETSYLRVDSISVPDMVRITFEAQPNLTYGIEAAGELNAPAWQRVESVNVVATASGGPTEVFLPVEPGQKYFRLITPLKF